MVNQSESLVVIVIPIYKEEPDLYEKLSIKQCFNVFYNYPITFIAPGDLNVGWYKLNTGNHSKVSFLTFDNFYFRSVEGYNKLLLSKSFYEKFLGFKFMLIYQPDAYVFSNALEYWCKKEYDYIGAPWVNWEWSEFYARHLTFPRRLLYKLGKRNFNNVGNGGLSLRRISSFINNLTIFSKAASKFDKNEYYFFSFYINSFNPFFKIAPFKEALKFAFDENPDQAFEINNKNLPMGSHAWPKYYQKFWYKYIEV